MRMFIIRHGESLGNVNEAAYDDYKDHKVPLTQWGYEQAVAAGAFLRKYLEKHPSEAKRSPRIWYSPFNRTQQTKDGVQQGLADTAIDSVHEDYLLREQDFGVFSGITDPKEQERQFPVQYKLFNELREKEGKCYAKAPLGESRLDVAQRVRLFKESLMRDVGKGIDDHIIVTHGVTARALEMDFLHKGVQWFEESKNPNNCDIVMIEGDREKGYKATKIYEGKTRPGHLPEDYKAAAHENAIQIS